MSKNSTKLPIPPRPFAAGHRLTEPTPRSLHGSSVLRFFVPADDVAATDPRPVRQARVAYRLVWRPRGVPAWDQLREFHDLGELPAAVRCPDRSEVSELGLLSGTLKDVDGLEPTHGTVLRVRIASLDREPGSGGVPGQRICGTLRLRDVTGPWTFRSTDSHLDVDDGVLVDLLVDRTEFGPRAAGRHPVRSAR